MGKQTKASKPMLKELLLSDSDRFDLEIPARENLIHRKTGADIFLKELSTGLTMHRLAIQSDLERVFSIYMAPNVVRYLGYEPMPLDSFGSIYQELIASKSFYVYQIDEVIAGFYKASQHPGRASHVGYLGSLAVAPEFQGHGVAERMVRGAMEVLCQTGAKRIELIVESDNPRAVTFYERLGFQKEGTLRKFYKRADEANFVDDYIMSVIYD